MKLLNENDNTTKMKKGGIPFSKFRSQAELGVVFQFSRIKFHFIQRIAWEHDTRKT